MRAPDCMSTWAAVSIRRVASTATRELQSADGTTTCHLPHCTNTTGLLTWGSHILQKKQHLNKGSYSRSKVKTSEVPLILRVPLLEVITNYRTPWMFYREVRC